MYSTTEDRQLYLATRSISFHHESTAQNDFRQQINVLVISRLEYHPFLMKIDRDAWGSNPELYYY